MKKKVFIDGSHGTTGLKIHERLDNRNDIELMAIPPEQRKNPEAKQHYLNSADIVFLCLPDPAARESVGLLTNPAVRVLDASTAHRTAEGWIYGIPELNPGQREKIKHSRRISVPGCYASGFCALLHPLVSGGLLAPDYPVSSYSITGYSGGGNQMIAAFQGTPAENREEICCRPKNLNLVHKHLPEMQKFGLLKQPPIFTPIVGNFFQGMLVFVPLYPSLMLKNPGAEGVLSYFADYYEDERFIRVAPAGEIASIADGFLSPTACNNTNMLEIFVFGRNDHLLLVARLDNLGKGASGAAVQNMNILLGVPEETGL
jgi:N-acetyl-gamma-glutamyl-phosphate reductase